MRRRTAVGAGLVSVTGTSTYGYTGGFAGRLGGTLAGLDNQITVKNVYGNCMKPDGPVEGPRATALPAAASRPRWRA